MKKLIIAAFAVTLAVAAQASQVTWSATTIAQSGTSTSYYAMMVDMANSTLTTAEEVAMALNGGTFDGKVIYEGAATYSATKGVTVAFAKKTTATAYQNGAEVDYMTIVFNNDSAASATQYLATSGDAKVHGVFSEAGLLLAQQGSQAGKQWADLAPEPTSGLMMLLGMGVLALRRRRA